MDPRTWWPYQSTEARDICDNLTALERWTVFAVTLTYGAWLVYAILWRLYVLAIDRTSAALESLGVFAALTLALLFVYVSVIKTALLRSRYGKKRVYLADAFSLFSMVAQKPSGTGPEETPFDK